MNIQEAMKIVTREIANDPNYRITWQANIAMAFKDQWMKTMEINSDCVDYKTIHDIANKAANNFLDILCIEANKETAKELVAKWDRDREETPID